MTQRIRNGAIVIREGRLWLLRPAPSGEWRLPDGDVLPEHLDVDDAMDAMLNAVGISAPAIEEDFIETVYLRDEQGHLVYNLYAPTEWEGEPATEPGAGAGWFAPDELEAVHMDSAIRAALLDLLGVKARPDDAAEIIAALGGGDAENAAGTPPPVARDASSDRRTAGLDVLRTLRGGIADPDGAFTEMRKRQPGLTEDVVDFALGEVWSHPALDRRTRSLQVMAMLGALGRSGPLRSHIQGALNHGATPEQVVQTMRMIAVYAGFPAAIEAWAVMADVFGERDIEIPGGPE